MASHVEIRIKGIVQGVGFRPFIYRRAFHHNILGNVRNDTEGVLIHAEGRDSDIAAFLNGITAGAPPLCVIDSVATTVLPVNGYTSFSIVPSAETALRSTFIAPDSAVCSDCLREFFDPGDRRYHYPFITCTNCGPRFSIVFDIPYDRRNTSMKDFTMCPDCSREYHAPLDRRFHTQPDACAVCGPRISLRANNGAVMADTPDDVARQTVQLLNDGRVVAIKSVGGYLIACDAKNDGTVEILRTRKNRPFKPFALMAGSIAEIKKFCVVTPEEEALLTSKERPIVILDKVGRRLSEHIAPSLGNIGVMLPYTPFQHHLFEIQPDMALVMTSGNVSDEPIIHRDSDAFARLGAIADYFVCYDREIVEYTDDSVLFIETGRPCFIRRSRGYAPAPFYSSDTGASILATGGDLKNCFGIARKNTIILSQFIGDLASPFTAELYAKTVDHFRKIYDFHPEAVVSDMHPGYFTSLYADDLEEAGLQRIRVQHHHAHIVSVMEDHGIDEQILGIAFDGTGYGPDHILWGSEFLLADRKDFSRLGHFSSFPLPGGESAIKDVWKIGIALLYQAFGGNYPLMRRDRPAEIVMEIIDKKINSPRTCSIGRLFDGISAMLGISHSISTEAEAAQLLEEAARKGARNCSGAARIQIGFSHIDGIEVLSADDIVRQVAELRMKGFSVEDAAFLFHQAVADATVTTAQRLRERTGIARIALSGGAFQNRILLRLITEGLREKRFDILTPVKIPFNDGCIALGQAAVAKERMK